MEAAAAGLPDEALASEPDPRRAAASAAAAEPMEVDSEADPYDFSDPKPVLPELKKDFWEGLESSKWLERKGALTMLRGVASAPRLAGGDFGDVNRELRKVLST